MNQSPDRPNIIMLVGEDVGRHHGCYGEPYAHTPHIDRLASQGACYTHGFSHAPVCAPSRSGLVTGRYPVCTGALHMRSTLLDPPRLFTHELRDAGYHVAWPTKLDFNFNPTDGWCDSTDDWRGSLADRPADQPFFLFRNFNNTHESGVWDPPAANNDFAHRTADLPDELRHDPAGAPIPAYLPDTPQTRQDISRYHDNLTIQDQQVGQVLDEIDAAGLADNTVVIYMSDHGRGLPREKRWLYDAGIRLPLIVRWPGRIAPGSVVDDLVAWVDLAPTILSLAGAPIPDDYDGQVFLGPDAAPPRQYIYAQRDRMDEVFDRVRCVRSKRWHYIRNFYPQLPWAQHQFYMEQEPTYQAMRELHAEGKLHPPADVFLAPTKPAEELYDAEADPDMVRNLADAPEHRAILEQHRAELDRFLASIEDLGAVTEEELIARGLVKDRLDDEYRLRIDALPPRYRVGGPEYAPLTMREAEAL